MTYNKPIKVMVLALLLALQIFEISAAELTLNLTPIPDVAAETAFAADPVAWLGRNSISSVAVFIYALNPPTRVTLVNGQIYSFRFTKVGNNKYVYYATPESSAGVKAYWLSTDARITVNVNSIISFIFTGELQGCSIHARIIPGSIRKLEVFHRNRQHLHSIYLDDKKRAIDSRGVIIQELAGITKFLDRNRRQITVTAKGKICLNNGILDRNERPITTINGVEVEALIIDNLNRGTDEICQFLNYDLRGGRTVSWENYCSNLPPNYEAALAASRGPPAFTTPFLFRKNQRWSFVSQQIQYSGTGGLARGRIHDFQFNGQGHLTPLND